MTAQESNHHPAQPSVVRSEWNRVRRKAVVGYYYVVYALVCAGFLTRHEGWRQLFWCKRFIDTHPVLPRRRHANR